MKKNLSLYLMVSTCLCSLYSAEVVTSGALHAPVAIFAYTLSKNIPLTHNDGSYNLLSAENFSALSTMILAPGTTIITERNPKHNVGCTSHYIIYGENVTTIPDPKDSRFNRSIVSQGTATISCLLTKCCRDTQGVLQIASSHTEKRSITVT